MLTATDVHYLVGFLTMMTSPDDVEITLGDLIYDEAAEEKRDVDVTVTYKDENGLLSAFKGIEVKKLGRRLNVTHVEQQIAKFKDMPSINHKAIISASGFTKPAVKKATAHGVELFSFVDWTNTMVGFEHIKFVPWMTAQQSIYTFASAPRVVFNPADVVPDEIRNQIGGDTEVYDGSGSVHPHYKTIADLTDRMEVAALDEANVHDYVGSLPSGKPETIGVNLDLSEEIFINIDSEQMRLKNALLIGPAMRVDLDLSLKFKILVERGKLIPIAGSAIAELTNGVLIAIAIGHADRSIKFVPVPLSIRNQEKIRMLKLK